MCQRIWQTVHRERVCFKFINIRTGKFNMKTQQEWFWLKTWEEFVLYFMIWCKLFNKCHWTPFELPVVVWKYNYSTKRWCSAGCDQRPSFEPSIHWFSGRYWLGCAFSCWFFKFSFITLVCLHMTLNSKKEFQP